MPLILAQLVTCFTVNSVNKGIKRLETLARRVDKQKGETTEEKLRIIKTLECHKSLSLYTLFLLLFTAVDKESANDLQAFICQPQKGRRRERQSSVERSNKSTP